MMVFSRMAETRVLKQLTDGDRTTSDGKLFHSVAVSDVVMTAVSHATRRPVGKKGKVFPYSLPSVGPGADPGVQAVSPQVT